MKKKGISGLIGIVVALIALSATMAAAVPFQKGDVFAAVNNGQVQHYDSGGVLLETLNTGFGGFTSGMAFDSSGNLYVTDFTANNVSVFNNTGALLGTFGSGYSIPESILFNAAGTVYVGNFGNGIRKFDSAGNFLDTVYPLRTDWIDLASDQCTMFITDEGTNIMRSNVCTKTSLPDFVASGLTHDYALRILSDGGVLVADTTNIKRYNSSGGLIQTYDNTSQDNWFALNLDPDGTSFWSGDFGNDKFFKFDIASGKVLMSVDTGKGGNNLFGLVVFGEITAAQPSGFKVTKDFRFTDVSFTAVPAQLGGLLPQTGGNYSVRYVLKPKDGTVSSTNPGQFYGVITVNGTGAKNVSINDTFGYQFDVNPGKLGGGVEVLRVNTSTGVATVLTDTAQVTSATVDNTGNTVKLTINLTTPLAVDENLMIYVKFMTAEKGAVPTISNDFVNIANVLVNGSPGTASATIKFT